MKLTDTHIKKINEAIKAGQMVEVYVDPDRVLEVGHGLKSRRGKKLMVVPKEPKAQEIHFPPVLLNDEKTTTLSLIAYDQDGEPVSVASVEIPPKVQVTGLLIARRD